MKKNTTNNEENTIMENLLQSASIPNIQKGEEVDAEILTLSKKSILFDIGAKALAVLGERELRQASTYIPYLQEGQNIRVRVIAEESREGFPVVSLQRFFDQGKWRILENKKEKEETIEVVCGEYGKGGVFVDFMGIRGVIPKIQLTQEFLQDPSKIQGQRVTVKVLEVDEEKNRLVVSKKAAELNISQKELRKLFKDIKEGETYEANVLGASEFGIFCEINGVEGLVHISEISWEKVTNASMYVKPGDKIKVLVVEKNDEDLKLNLSIKRLQNDPWKDIEKRYPKDKVIKGEVIRKERYGYFVRLEAGIEGLIHISKLGAEDHFTIGDTINVFIERINTRERRISLVLPQKDKPIFYR